ncbi:hypothetical protein GR925_28965 [Streptomyces sp. HUCO-GS316]|nr:hypothetical protein [Streptomyces sp. HUCO-GS316]
MRRAGREPCVGNRRAVFDVDGTLVDTPHHLHVATWWEATHGGCCGASPAAAGRWCSPPRRLDGGASHLGGRCRTVPADPLESLPVSPLA